MLNDWQITDTDVERTRVKSNYHAHNYLCGHADGTVTDYVAEAVRGGMEIIGISDHCVSPRCRYDPYMTPKTMRTQYLPQFDEARALYGSDIKILAGAEIEYFDGFDAYYKDILSALDYLVLGQHEYMLGDEQRNSFFDIQDEADAVAYCENVIRGLRTGYFSVLAHPDLMCYREPEITPAVEDAFERMIVEAKNSGVAVELNANGCRSHWRRYPTDLLIGICKKHDVPVVVSSDAHQPKELCDKHTKGVLAYALKRGLNVTDAIRLPKK